MFNWLDYSLLIVYLLGLAFIAGRWVKEKNLEDFFLGSRRMPWYAVSASILATLLSAISLAGVPAEFWEHGLQISWATLVIPFFGVFIVSRIFVRPFVAMRLTTAYGYLEKRFSNSIRLIAAVFFALFRGAYASIVLYGAALVFSPPTGIHPVFLIVIIGGFSILYAVIGGIKSVIWTDLIQMIVIYGGVTWLLISILLSLDGGLSGIVNIAASHNKLFSFVTRPDYWSFDLFEQTTVWGIFLGYLGLEVAGLGTDQLAVQRFLAASSEKKSVLSLWGYALFALPVGIILWLLAAALFAFYTRFPERLQDTSPNQILGYYITNEVPHGISGIFMAAILAAVISTANSVFNSLATVTMTDFLAPFSKNSSPEKQVLNARLWTVFWGLLCILLSSLIYFTARENIVRTTNQVLGLFSGILLGIFLLGIFTRRAHSRGVLLGSLLGFALVIYTNYFWTRTAQDGSVIHISFVWPVVIGSVSCFIFGYILSLVIPDKKTQKQTAR